MPSSTEIRSLINSALKQSAERCFRLPLVLSGEENWITELASSFGSISDDLLWLGEGSPVGIEPQTFATARTWLGRELDVVVINTFSGLDVDGLGAVSGTIRAGGMLVLLTPSLDAWHHFPDPEHAKLAVAGHAAESISGRKLARLAKLIREDEQVLLIEQNQPLPEPAKLSQAAAQQKITFEPYATADQQFAVEKIFHTLQQDNPVPLVMTADRGRGKSAALGLAAGQMLQQKNIRIGITGPRLAAVEQVFSHAATRCPEANVQRNRIHLPHSRLDYFAPDELIREQPQLDVLLVDEAAAIPAPMLEKLLQLYPRIVFSSTLHGYEGSGRGFALRFRMTLDQQAPGWQTMELKQPIRWAQGDPLEQFIFRALLLDVDLQPVLAGKVDAAKLQFSVVDRDQLAHDEKRLREIFSLLVWAHYQTQPQDLRNLLDGPNVQLGIAVQAGQVLAVLLLCEEGGFDEAMAQAIVRGERRPRGHLVPQSLALHAGFAQAATLRYGRIMRIAVHPECQRQGIGRALLEFVAENLSQGLDMLCASFGATPELLDFWQHQGYQPLRLGFSRDQASGCHSVMLARPCSDAGAELFAAMTQRFAQSLTLLREDGLQDLDAELLQRLPQLPAGAAMSAQDWQDVLAFAAGQRGYESCLLGLWRWRHSLPEDLPEITLEQNNILKNKIIASQSWQSLVAAHDFAGRRDAIKALERIVFVLTKAYKFKG